MPCNDKVFVSHAHSDNVLCDSLVAWLRYWGIDFWFDRVDMSSDTTLADNIQKAVQDRDILLRICTPAAQESFYCKLERDMFIGLMARDHRAGNPGARRLINLIADPNYAIEPIDLAYPYILSYGRPPMESLTELRGALQSAPAESARVPLAGHVTGITKESAPVTPRPPLPILPEPDNIRPVPISPPTARGADGSAQVNDGRLALFIDDDDGYVGWLSSHRHGYVLNCERHPKSNYLMLHRTSCHTISGAPARDGGRPNVWTAAFMKVCSDDRAAIEDWAQNTTSGSVRPCRFCHP